MSDTTAKDQANDDQEQTSEKEETNWEEEAKKWKALSRQNERNAKALLEKARKWDEREQAEMTEVERLKQQLEQTQKQLADTKLSALKARVAAKHGVPAEYITGEDEDSLTASAEGLKAFVQKAERTPSSDVQGERGDDVPPKSEATDINALLRAAL